MSNRKRTRINMIKTDLKPIKVYTRKMVLPENDKNLEIIINVYNEPIVSSEARSCYTRFSIMDGTTEWGYGLLPFPVEEEDADYQLGFIESNAKLFKRK